MDLITLALAKKFTRDTADLKASLSTFVGITQAEYDALETKTEPMYFIFEDEEESTVSNSAGTNSIDKINSVSDLTVQGDETE